MLEYGLRPSAQIVNYAELIFRLGENQVYRITAKQVPVKCRFRRAALVNSQSKLHSGKRGGSYIKKEKAVEFNMGHTCIVTLDFYETLWYNKRL